MSKMFPLTLRTDDHEIQLHADGTVTGDLGAMKEALARVEGDGNEAVAIIWLVMQVLELRKRVP